MCACVCACVCVCDCVCVCEATENYTKICMWCLPITDMFVPINKTCFFAKQDTGVFSHSQGILIDTKAGTTSKHLSTKYIDL